VKINLFVFHRSPESFNEQIVTPRAFAVHPGLDAMHLKQIREGLLRELRALVGVHDLRCSVTGDRFLHGLNAKVHVHGYRDPPGQNSIPGAVDGSGNS